MLTLFDGFNDLFDVAENALSNRFTFLKTRKIEDKTNLELISLIQPTGSVKFNPTYVKFGDAYMACVHVYSTPEYVSRHWLYDLYCINGDINITFDIMPIKTHNIKEKIKKSVDENLSRYENAHDILEAKDAHSQLERLNNLLDEIEKLGNIVLASEFRIFVYASTFYDLEKNIKEIEDVLKVSKFTKYCVNYNEQYEEFQSLFLPFSETNKTLSRRKGIPIPANKYAQGLPFFNTWLTDERGFYLGNTTTQSGIRPVIFTPFLKDKYRSCYDMFLCGVKGTGKSTTIKMLIEKAVITRNKVKIIDVTGEFQEFVNNLNGVIVKFDSEGKNIRLNLLEILRMEDNDTKNYHQHIAKLSHIYRIMSPDCTEQELSIYKEMLKKLYVKFGIIPNEHDIKFNNITGLPSERYPIFSDFLKIIKEEINTLENDTTSESRYKLKYLLAIDLKIGDLLRSYGSMFDGHTTIKNAIDANVISYDLSSIKEVEDRIFDMMLFNVLSMAYDSCMKIGTKMKNLYDKRQIDEEDIIYHLIVIDECHYSINANRPFAIERMLQILRMDRKYFIGVCFATTNLGDMFRNGTDNATKDLKTLFENCQYKMIFRQEPGTVPVIQEAFVNVFTPLQIKEIPKLKNREMVLNLTPIQTIRLMIRELPDGKLAYYGGGK